MRDKVRCKKEEEKKQKEKVRVTQWSFEKCTFLMRPGNPAPPQKQIEDWHTPTNQQTKKHTHTRTHTHIHKRNYSHK